MTLQPGDVIRVKGHTAMIERAIDWMGPFEHGHWGVVQHTPGKWPEWRGTAQWSKETAQSLTDKYNAIHLESTILRHPPGTRCFPVESTTLHHILLQFERIMESHR